MRQVLVKTKKETYIADYKEVNDREILTCMDKDHKNYGIPIKRDEEELIFIDYLIDRGENIKKKSFVTEYEDEVYAFVVDQKYKVKIKVDFWDFDYSCLDAEFEHFKINSLYLKHNNKKTEIVLTPEICQSVRTNYKWHEVHKAEKK